MARNGSAVLQPNLGLYLGQPPLYTPKRGLRDCLNVRIKNGAIVRDNVGYGPFPLTADPTLNLDNLPVTLIDNFFPRSGGQLVIFGNTRDLFEYDEANERVDYLTPRYETGTVSVTNGSATVTGSGTSWSSELKAGDQIHIGATGERDPASTWYEIDSVDSDTQVTLTTTYAGVTDSGLAYTARVVFTGDVQDYFETAIFFSAVGVTGTDGDRWYATNGVDPVVAWDGDADQVYFPSLGTLERCRSLATYKNILVYINVRVSGENLSTSVITSAIGEPENITTKESGQFTVHDGADPVLTGFTLGENLALYAERSITLVQFVGAPTVFVFRTVIDGLGPRAARGIADFGDFHVFVGPDSQYTFDGVTLTESNGHVWREIIRQSSPQRLDLINSHFDEENGELIWIVPLNSDADTAATAPPEKAFIEHYLEDVGKEGAPGVYTKRDIPATAMGFYERLTTLTFDQIAEAWEDQNYRWNDQFFQAAFPFNVMGTATGDIYILSTKDSANGTALRSFARFGRRPLGNLEQRGIIRRIYPMVERLPSSNHDLTVKLYTGETPGANVTQVSSLAYPMAEGTVRHFVCPRKAARYAEVEFETNAVGAIWTLIGYDWLVAPGGRR